jgi:ribonuclease E
MSKEIYISSTPHETRLAIVENDALTEIYYERENEYTLAGSIYNGRVTRVLPGMQSSFVDIGLERDAFLYITDFLEEAGESADFEGGTDGETRGARGDGQRRERSDRGDRPDRGDRSDRGDRGERPTTIEGTIAAPAERSGERGAARGEEGGPRGDRNDRNRGRNRRGRGDRDRSQGNGERSGNDVDRIAEPMAAPLLPPPPSLATPPEFGEPVGEGAPGADGSRRWRGRRGRRRGRGGMGDATRPVAGTEGTPEGEAYPEVAGFAAQPEGHTQEEFTDYPLEIDGAAVEAAPESARVEDEVRAAEPVREERGERGDGRRDRERGRGDRNGRGRSEGRGEGRGRGDRDQRPPRAPRGFAPSRDLYAVEATAGEETVAPVEPIILPGESLSKYRSPAEQAAVAAAAPSAAPTAHVILPKPKTVVDETAIATGWDGGFTLPGESLSRRNRPEASASRNEARAAHRSNRTEERSNFRAPSATPESGPGAKAGLPQVVEELDGLSVASAPEQQPEVAQAAHPELVTESEILQETVAHAAGVSEQPAVVAPQAEYEPEEASASYRVDPIAPSEFRHSGFFESETIEVAASEGVAQGLDTTGVPPPPPPFAGEPVAAGHEVTSLAETGEMYSEPVLPEAAVAAESVELETSPMLHEGAIHEAVAAPVAAISEPGQGFAPGQGALEEEILEEDDAEPVALHAGYAEEFEDLEEETLEGAADLGTMLREMSIDQITAPGDVEEEDEEFEEEEADEAEFGDAVAADSEEEFAEGDKPTQSAEDAEFFESTFREPAETEEGGARTGNEIERRPRRDGRRDRGRGDRDRGRDRSRSTGGEHERGRSGGRRQSAQATNLPAISDLLKPGQEILVQIAKEPIAKKGARITSHIALPGRFLVFMPTVNHTGVSRKIESDAERRRLKEILLSEKGEASGGFIVRTAASGASEEELRSDLRFLLNLWTDIKTRSEASKSPALIYHDLNLVERILRDQVTDTFSAIWVDTESEYERVLRFLQRFQPSLIRRVKLYTKETPLFEQFGITEEINKALRSKVWLKSGGSIVINQTEALVAIDINTGKFVGKTARLEDTIVKTNLDAIPEIVRQIRLRDLGGIIIIDFIDMDERRNRNKVMAALEEELKTDRAPSKVLQFNDFGLVAITRKRVKQSLERTLSTTCGVCQGTGMVKSPITVCNDIYIEMRKMHKHLDRGDVMLRVHPDVIKQLKSGSAKWLQEMEEMVGKTILIKSDPSLHPEQFDIH